MTTQSGPPLVRAVGLCKDFGGMDVLSRADLELHAGEIHGVVGENGAGKSTLAKLIGGVYIPRAGHVEVAGEPVSLTTPRDAIARGIALIHQEPLTFPDLTVAENIFVGRQPKRRGRVAWAAMTNEAGRILDSLAVRIDPRAKVSGLSIADQQMVEMAAALSQNARVLLMDETTAALTPREVQRLVEIMRRLRDGGAALAFVSHRMEEIFAVCDRITVLRDGQVVGSRRTAETSVDEVLRMMVGRPMEALFAKPAARSPGDRVLEISDLSREGEFRNVNLHVCAGEIVSLAGLVGSGRTQVAEAIFGITRTDSGQISIHGQPVRIRHPRHAMTHGLALVPEDRQHHGVFMPQSVWHNVSVTVMGRFARFGWLCSRRSRDATGEYVNRLNIRLRDMYQAVRELSGGNQQKVVLAKWLLTEPRVLILDEPTRGIDIAAKAEVHRRVSDLAAAGMAVLMISSDLPEVLSMSDRILVMREGRLVDELTAAQATATRVIAAATGQGRQFAQGNAA